MKLPEVQIKGVESLGRQNLSAVGNVARGQAGVANAQARALGHVSNLVGQIAETQDRMEYDKAIAEYRENLTNWQMKYGSKEFFDGEEIQNMVSDPERLKENVNGDDGKNVSMFRKNIPAYEVYANMLDNKMQGLQKTYGMNIRNNNLATDFVNSTDELRNQKMLRETIKASQQQHQQERTDSQVRITQYASSGQLKEALFEVSKFNGTDFEKAELAEKSRHAAEIYQYREAIRTENLPVMIASLETLQSEHYQDAGVLTTEENNAEQSLLRTAIGRFQAKAGGVDKAYKADISLQADTLITEMGKGYVPTYEEITRLATETNRLELYNKFEKLKFYSNHAEPVHNIQLLNTKDTAAYINEYVSKYDGAKQSSIRRYLQNAALETRKRIESDTVQHIMDHGIAEVPAVGSEDFYRKMGDIYWSNRQTFGVASGVLSDAQAKQISQNLVDASPMQKAQFTGEVLAELKPAEAEIVFKQVAGNAVSDLVVIGDMVERGQSESVRMLDIGSKLRRDENMKIMPPASKFSDINVTLAQLYPNQPQMQSYVMKGILDVYAFHAQNDPNTQVVDSDYKDDAMERVIGATTDFNGLTVRLPSKDVDTAKFHLWAKNIDPASFQVESKIGSSQMVVDELRKGNYKLINTPERGAYIVQTVNGTVLSEKRPAGVEAPLRPLILRYNEDNIKHVIPEKKKRRQGGR